MLLHFVYRLHLVHLGTSKKPNYWPWTHPQDRERMQPQSNTLWGWEAIGLLRLRLGFKATSMQRELLSYWVEWQQTWRECDSSFTAMGSARPLWPILARSHAACTGWSLGCPTSRGTFAHGAGGCWSSGCWGGGTRTSGCCSTSVLHSPQQTKGEKHKIDVSGRCGEGWGRPMDSHCCR